jgi:hypothetical protein
MKENIEDPVCIIEVNENIRRVETGQPLTRSLLRLNKNCGFREKYEKVDQIINPIKRCNQCGKELTHIGYCSESCRLKKNLKTVKYREYRRKRYLERKKNAGKNKSEILLHEQKKGWFLNKKRLS